MIEINKKTDYGYDSLGIFNTVNTIGETLAYPGKWFTIDPVYRISFGIAFMGIIGTILALSMFALGFH